jgi:hypothetical protein
MDYSQIAFIDESGDPSLKVQKQGVTKLFAVVAILVDADAADDFKEEVNSLRQKHFGPGEMKSSGVGGNFDRRHRIIDDILDLGFHFYTLIVDKERIFKDSGLQYKRTFIKHLNGKLHRALFHAYPDIKIVADEHGSREFMDGFKGYIMKRHRPDLFYRASFEFVDSKDDVLVQLADILAGTMRICAREDAGDEERELIKSLDDHLIGLDQWPIRFYSRHLVQEANQEEDRLVQQQSIRRAQAYVDEHASNVSPGSDRDLCVQCLRYLLFRARFDDVNEYAYSQEIRSHIEKRTRVGLSVQQFQSRVVSKLRDAGVLIASSGKGYKLPESMQDIRTFLSYQSGMIEPMLRRIEGYREQLLLASKNEVDILDAPQYSFLRDFFD